MAWKKGQSGNPGGRPKHGNGLAEVIRKKLDPEVVYEKLIKIVETSPSEQTQLRALELLMERGWKKPAQVVEVGPADPFEDMSDEELAALEAQELAVLQANGALALPEADADADVVQDESEARVEPWQDFAKRVDPSMPVGQNVVSPAARAVSHEPRGGSEARTPLAEAEGAECRTTSVRVGAGASVQVRKRAWPEDE